MLQPKRSYYISNKTKACYPLKWKNTLDKRIHEPYGSLVKLLSSWKYKYGLISATCKQESSYIISSNSLVVGVCWLCLIDVEWPFEVEVWRELLIWGSEQNLLCFSTMLILPRLPRPVLTRRLSPASRCPETKISFVVLHKCPPHPVSLQCVA